MHIDQHEQLLNQFNTALKHHPEFERAFSDFEAQKVCYLPIGAFMLKPIQRLLHYHSLLERELGHLFIYFWHVPLRVHSAKRRHQSPQWVILSQVDCFIQREVK